MQIIYENITIAKEYSKLIEYINNTTNLHQYFESSFGKTKPKNYCGFLATNENCYFIAPKITNNQNSDLNIFIYMLLFANNIKISNIDTINLATKSHKIFELFIKIFSDTLLNELKKGLFKKYITMQENLKMLRGKYIIDKNFTNFYHQNIYCEYDEFSEDNELNRFFLYAIKVFKRFSNYSNLSKCELILSDVKSYTIDYNRFNFNFDRLSNRYKDSFDLALMILKKLTPLTNKANNKSFAFLFDMGEVFEKFVANLFKGIDSTTQTQKTKIFGNLVLKPDIITQNKIIDTKYKKLNSKDDLLSQDKYQMFAYGINFGKRDTMLLYPKHLEDINENLVLGKDENKVFLALRSLDLSFSGEYSEFIEEMKRRLEEI